MGIGASVTAVQRLCGGWGSGPSDSGGSASPCGEQDGRGPFDPSNDGAGSAGSWHQQVSRGLPQKEEDRLADHPEADRPALAGVDAFKLYDTGARRSHLTERYDLVPLIGLKRVALTMAEGAEKYGLNNWEKGFPVNDILNHALAHIFNHLAGDRSEDHLGHAAANLLMAIDTEAKNGSRS